MTHNFEPQAYLEDMDAEGVDIAVCFTGIGLYATWGDNLDPDLSAAMCRAYNNWLYDFMSHDPARLKGVCLLPLQDIELAAEELRRCATELGMVGIFWRPNPHMGRLMSDRAYDPITPSRRSTASTSPCMRASRTGCRGSLRAACRRTSHTTLHATRWSRWRRA